MNLPFLKKFNKKVLPSYFLVLVLRDEKVNAVIFEEIEGKAKLVGQKEEYFSASIDEISPDEFLQTLDKAISTAESSLPENIQTQKTIFGVKETWTENDQIKKEYLARLKKASQELGMTPIGFLVISQAISHLLQKEEGAPISAILAEVNKKTVTVTLIRAGKSIETKSAEIHETIPFTVDTILKHFNIPEILPSRIVVFNGKEDLSQEFISHTWSKSLPFLHLPQITNLPHGFDAKAVLFGAATQMGFAITETQKRDETQKKTEMQNISTPENDSVNSVEDSRNSVIAKNIGADNFGFSQDLDVAKMEFPTFAEASAGRQEPIETNKETDNIPQINQEETLTPKTKSVKNGKNILISIASSLLTFAKKINIGKIFSKIPRGKITFIIPAILILIFALIVSYLLFIKATIEITIDPKITEQNKNVLISTISRTDPTENIIKGEFVSVSEDGTVLTSATGKKDVGTKAKGAIAILSSLSDETTIKEGSIVTSSNGLQFIIDDNIKIASSSGLDDLKSSKANVTAKDLGKEYNLPSGTKFTIGSFDSSQVVAKNDNPFSGGTKKEVTVVSKTDETKLENDLTKQLEEKAKSELAKQIGQNKVLLPAFISSSLSKETLNVKVGDEATQVTLTGTVEYQGISYDRQDLIAFSKSLLEKDIPSNQEIDYNNIKTAVKDIKNKNDEEINANLNIKALLLPKIDQANLVKNIKGKSFKNAEDLLYKNSQISNVYIYLSPKIPFLPKNLPNSEKNIKILIKING